MKKEFIRNLPGYAEFRTVCSFEKCEDEYPGWTGKEKYIVFSQLSRRELERRFPEITKAISPYILIDDSVSDALVATQLVDGILFVVRQNYCDRNALSAALDQFRFVKTRILGVVLNCTTEGSH